MLQGKISYRIENGEAFADVEAGTVRRCSLGESPLGDHDALLEAGSYRMDPMTVDFRRASVEDAYWFSVWIPGTMLHANTWARREAGSPTHYSPQPYGYVVRDGKEI